MRLFIAIRLNEQMQEQIFKIQQAFQSKNISGNYSPSEKLHITLAFIGEYNDPEKVLDIMKKISFKPFVVVMDSIGRIDKLWWTGIVKSNGLERLSRILRHKLSDAGIPFDNRKFRPHITFLRNAKVSEEGMIPCLEFEPDGMTVKEISLMQSTQGKHGMVYKELGSVLAEEGSEKDDL